MGEAHLRVLRAAALAAAGLALAGAPILARTAAAAGERPVRVVTILSEARPSHEEAERGFVEELERRGFAPTVRRVVGEVPGDVTACADLLLALGTEAAVRARGVTGPAVVFALVGDPAGAGLAAGGASRHAGVAALPPAADQVALLRDVDPDARRVGLVYNPARSGGLADDLAAAAAAAGL
ncbi:MAG TPA: hypothetical protein VHF22_06775, partial [Planctomycetota bacterium]|nr:hypothetical protein [Planctomycetota bacterium]